MGLFGPFWGNISTVSDTGGRAGEHSGGRVMRAPVCVREWGGREADARGPGGTAERDRVGGREAARGRRVGGHEAVRGCEAGFGRIPLSSWGGDHGAFVRLW